MERDIVLIAHNLRSTHNVGSLLRTAEGLGITKIYLTGYTPYPAQSNDKRLPHVAQKLDRQISKTALGAEMSQPWEQTDALEPVIRQLKKQEYAVVALEQAAGTTPLQTYKPPEKIALLIGNEVSGLSPESLALSSKVVEIPMFGQKESFNVVQAAAMALYHIRFA
jgi:tRNA G18 (ribose-2'-O)-methylase SpoU